MERWSTLHPIGWLCAMGLLLAACGGAPTTPTPLPADVVRPEQPTPIYGDSATFSDVAATPIFATPIYTPSTSISAAITAVAPALNIAALAQLPPTGMGIVLGGTSLLDSPGGAVVASLPAGTPLTLTGKSADGAWLTAYTNAGAAGWVKASALARYGDDQLIVVTEAFGPGPAATLVADALIPIAMPPIDLTPPVSISGTTEISQ